METGTVNYSARISGNIVERERITSRHSNILSIETRVDNDKELSVIVRVQDVYAEEWPISSIVDEVRRFFTILSFHDNCSIKDMRNTGFSLMKDDRSGVSRVISSCVINLGIEAPPCIINGGEDSLQTIFDEDRDKQLLNLYTSAIQHRDPLAKFMFLYSTLLSMNNDIQERVDEAILRVAPDTIYDSSPFKKNTNETIYTRLRNEVGHNRDSCTFGGTMDEIRSVLCQFERIVWNLVDSSSQLP